MMNIANGQNAVLRLETGARSGQRWREKTMSMMSEIAVIILIALNIYTLSVLNKHETALYELLRLHPELLEDGDDDGD